MKPLDLKITNSAKQITKPNNANNRFSNDQKRKLAKASKGFETMLTSLMIKSMTKSAGGLFGSNNYGGDIFDTMFENEIAGYITETKGLGIAGKIFENLTGEKFDPKLYKTKILHGNLNSTGNGKIEKSTNTKGSKLIDKLKKYEDIINEASEKYNIDTNLIKSVILTESGANPKAHSKNKAKGLMQLLDSTADSLGVKNIWDPKQNIFGGTKYLSNMLRQYDGDKDLALAAYNAGPGNVAKYKGIPPFKETKIYIKRVKNYLNNLEL